MTDKQRHLLRIMASVLPDAVVRLKQENERLEAIVKVRRAPRRERWRAGNER